MEEENPGEETEGYEEEVDWVDEVLDADEEGVGGSHCLDHLVDGGRWYGGRETCDVG